jgi:hypothetical protein
MLGLCLAILGPIWPKALAKMVVHPAEGVMAQDDVSDADDTMPGILPVAALPRLGQVRCAVRPVDRLPLTLELDGTSSGPRAPPCVLSA